MVAVTRKFQVKVKPLKLAALEEGGDEEKKQRVVAIKIKWKGEPKFAFVPFPQKSKQKKDLSSEKIVKKGQAIEWDDEFVHTCCFTMASNLHRKFGPWNVSFDILHGEKTESKSKLVVIGRGLVNLGEIVSRMESHVECNIPINMQIAGVAREVSLTVLLNLVEIIESRDSATMIIDSAKSTDLKGLTRNEQIDKYVRETEKGPSQEELKMDETEKSATIYREIAAETSLINESGSSSTAETQLESDKKYGWFSWKSRHFSFKAVKTKEEPLIKKAKIQSNDSSAFHSIPNGRTQKAESTESSLESKHQNEENIAGSWEEKDLVSRDGHTKLKASVFFASFDQRSDKAAGESACTALVAVISHWLQSNPNALPNRSEFGNLIIEGSSEWQKLCENHVYVYDFPNKHFDLETILKADIRPIAISHEKSFVGFFGAETFESLKGAMSFDEIWDEISRNSSKDYAARIFIVSWNDHFFVLKMESDAYYIIDTLGERLFEGCNQAYVLRFDPSALMHGQGNDGENEEIICSGKECCREFIKRFLAAIPLKELEEDEKKKAVSILSLHQRLQIEFNFTNSTSPPSSLTSSPFSSPDMNASRHFSSEECD